MPRGVRSLPLLPDSRSVVSLPALLFLCITPHIPTVLYVSFRSFCLDDLILCDCSHYPSWGHSVLCAWASNILQFLARHLLTMPTGLLLVWKLRSIPFSLSTLHFQYFLFLVGVTILKASLVLPGQKCLQFPPLFFLLSSPISYQILLCLFLILLMLERIWRGMYQVLTSLSSCSFSLLLPSLGPHFLWPPAWSPCLPVFPSSHLWLMGLLYQRNNCNHINCLSKNLCWDLVCTRMKSNCLASHFKAFYTIILADLLPFP